MNDLRALFTLGFRLTAIFFLANLLLLPLGWALIKTARNVSLVPAMCQAAITVLPG